MTSRRKRTCKLLMSLGLPRNDAQNIAGAAVVLRISYDEMIRSICCTFLAKLHPIKDPGFFESVSVDLSARELVDVVVFCRLFFRRNDEYEKKLSRMAVPVLQL